MPTDATIIPDDIDALLEGFRDHGRLAPEYLAPEELARLKQQCTFERGSA